MRVFVKRFEELSEQLKKIESSQTSRYNEFSGRSSPYIEYHAILNWAVKARSLIAGACGKESEHYAAFEKADEVQSFDTNVDRLNRIKAVFLAAKEDFEGGYLNSVRNLVQSELAGDELDQARQLFSSGYTAAAGVVAGVVLETTLRTLSARHGLPAASMDRMNAELAKAGQYNTLVQKRITSMSAVRNSAAHGKVQDYTADDVKNLISETERFVGDMLS